MRLLLVLALWLASWAFIHGSVSGGEPDPSGEHIVVDRRALPIGPPSLASIRELEYHISQQIKGLRARRPQLPSLIITDLKRLLSILKSIDNSSKLSFWLKEIRSDPSSRQKGLSYRSVRALPDIRTNTLQLFQDVNGVIPQRGPLGVVRCIHPTMASQIYVRYVAYYGGMPNNLQIPLYFGMQLYAEFVLGMKVDFYDRRPDAGPRVGHLQHLHGMTSRQGVDINAVASNMQHLVEKFGDSTLPGPTLEHEGIARVDVSPSMPPPPPPPQPVVLETIFTSTQILDLEEMKQFLDEERKRAVALQQELTTLLQELSSESASIREITYFKARNYRYLSRDPSIHGAPLRQEYAVGSQRLGEFDAQEGHGLASIESRTVECNPLPGTQATRHRSVADTCTMADQIFEKVWQDVVGEPFKNFLWC